MTNKRQLGRPNYGGKFANLHETMAIPNHAEPVDNEKILAAAEQTRKQFYDQHTKVLVGIAANANKKKS